MKWSDLRERRRSEGPPFVWESSSYIPEKYVLIDTETGQVWGHYPSDVSGVGARRVLLGRIEPKKDAENSVAELLLRLL